MIKEKRSSGSEYLKGVVFLLHKKMTISNSLNNVEHYFNIRYASWSESQLQ